MKNNLILFKNVQQFINYLHIIIMISITILLNGSYDSRPTLQLVF